MDDTGDLEHVRADDGAGAWCLEDGVVFDESIDTLPSNVTGLQPLGEPAALEVGSVLRSFRCCRFGLIYRKDTNPWFARCPYHLESATVRCTKTFGCGGTDADCIQKTLTRIKYWCSMALDFDRKWQHSLFHLGLDEVPLEAIVDIGMPSSVPPRPIPTDAELDALEPVALALSDVVAPEEPQMMADDVDNSSSSTSNPMGMDSD